VQLLVTLPFQIVCALVFDFTVYGMAGLRAGDGAMWKNGTLLTLLYLIATQVRRAVGRGCCGCSPFTYPVYLSSSVSVPVAVVW
jgi:hypothetical protein